MIWLPVSVTHKKKAFMIINLWTKTPLYLSPYLCYGWKNLCQCWHLSFGDRSYSILNISVLPFWRNIWFDHCCMCTNAKDCETIHRCLQLILLGAMPEMEAFSCFIQTHLFQLKPNFFFLLNCIEALQNSQWKGGQQISLVFN